MILKIIKKLKSKETYLLISKLIFIFGIFIQFAYCQDSAVVANNMDKSKDAAKSGMGSLMENGYIQFVKNLLIAVCIVTVLIIISILLKNFVRKKILAHSFSSEDEYAIKIGDLISDIVFYCLLIFSVFMGFQFLGFDVSIILGGLTFGIGFAFKEILSNMISGILIITTKEFKLGDIIEIEGTYDYFGRVEEITIRYTVIRTLNMRKIIIPNLVMVTNPIKTYTSEDIVRLETTVSVHYDTDVEKTAILFNEAVNTIDFVVEKDSTKVQLLEFGDSGLVLRVLFFIDPNCGRNRPSLVSDVNKKLLETIRKNNITISYPHQVLTVDKNDKNLLASMLYVKKK